MVTLQMVYLCLIQTKCFSTKLTLVLLILCTTEYERVEYEHGPEFRCSENDSFSGVVDHDLVCCSTWWKLKLRPQTKGEHNIEPDIQQNIQPNIQPNI